MRYLRTALLLVALAVAPAVHAYDFEALETRAKGGDVDAQYQVGTDYANGLVVQQDLALAEKWFRRAARKGHVQARAALGQMYQQGMGVTRNFVTAHMWFNLAAASSDEAVYRSTRDSLANRMDAAQIAEAEERARDWLRKHRD